MGKRKVQVIGVSGGLGPLMVGHFRAAGDEVTETHGASWGLVAGAYVVLVAPLGPVSIIKLVTQALEASERCPGVVVFSGGGVGGKLGDDHPIEYAADKAAIVVAVERLSVLGKVNCVAPGMLGIGLNKGRTPDAGVLEKTLAMVDWLCTPASNHITGRLLSARWDTLEQLSRPMGDDDYRLRRKVPE